MTLPIYPDQSVLPGLSVAQKWLPRFAVQTAVASNLAEIDVAIAQAPLHDFELSYNFLRDGVNWGNALTALEFRTLFGFFLQVGGPAGRFAYRNSHDYKVFQQQIGTGDGATTTFTLTRTYGAGGFSGTEPVGLLDTGALFDVYLAGSSTPVNPALYTLNTASPCAQTITFSTAPASGAAIAVDMQYRYYCKFVDSSLTFEKFMDRIWSVGKVALRSCRAGA